MSRALAIFLLLNITLFANSVSLDEILEYALKHTLTLKIKKMEAKIESKNIDIAKSSYYPKFDISYDTEYSKSLEGLTFSSKSINGVSIPSSTRYQDSIVLAMNYDIYNFGAKDKQVNIAKISKEIKEKEWCEQKKNLYLQIIKAYTDVLKEQVKIEYKNKMLLIREKLYEAKKRFYDARRYSKIELADEAIAILALQKEIADAKMRYKEGINSLSTLSYMNFEKQTRLAFINTNVTTLNKIRYEDSSEAKILTYKIRQKKEQIALKIKEKYPSFKLYSNYYIYASDSDSFSHPFLHMRKNSWNVGMSVRFNIFDGFKSSSVKERLFLELEKLKQEYNEKKHLFLQKVNSTRTKINELHKLKSKEKELIAKNREKLSMIKRLRAIKKIDLLTSLKEEYELYSKNLHLKLQKIDIAFEKRVLDITTQGDKKCVQH